MLSVTAEGIPLRFDYADFFLDPLGLPPSLPFSLDDFAFAVLVFEAMQRGQISSVSICILHFIACLLSFRSS